MSYRSLLFILCLALPNALRAADVSIVLPPETGIYKAAPGVDLVNANCLMCHSTEYVSSQPPMPRKFWEANVAKMKVKFGAPIADAQIAALVDYLVAAYGIKDPSAP